MKKLPNLISVKNLPDFALLGVAVIWGWTFVLVKESLYEIGTFSFLFYRFGLALLLLLLLFGHRLKKLESGIWMKGTLIGVALFCGYWFQTWGLVYTTATNSAFITGLSVVLVPLLGAAFFKVPVAKNGWWGALLSLLGLGLIVFGTGGGKVVLKAGDFLTVLGAISFALHILLIGYFTRPENYLPILVTQIGVVAMLSGLGMCIREGISWPSSPVVWKGIVITGLFATALAFWAQNRFQPDSSPVRAAIIFSGEPVFAGLFGYLLLGEQLAGLQWSGALLILAAILVTQLPKSA